MKNHEPEIYGGRVEKQAEVHTEALRRARARNTEDNFNEAKTHEAQHEGAVISHDGEPYSAAERMPASPPVDEQLNWNNGANTMTPSAVPEGHFTGLQRPPRTDTGLSGVDAIVGFTHGER